MKAKAEAITKNTASISFKRQNSGTAKFAKYRQEPDAAKNADAQSVKSTESGTPLFSRGAKKRSESFRRAEQGEKREKLTRIRSDELAGRKGRINRKFIDSLSDEDVERMADEDPESQLEMDWSRAKIVLPKRKASIHLRIDADTLEWFRSRGRGYLTQMNAVLRSYYLAQR